MSKKIGAGQRRLQWRVLMKERGAKGALRIHSGENGSDAGRAPSRGFGGWAGGAGT
ncbi:hypothetical protein [Paenibacillus caseinilyticus]|uniref:hypothetical protein n=1 Tax=Paenibacillus caseinilyticus TaxID=3098138 RepID=UPI0022B8FB06|nr:hypothetical protein [Paenibacillus caseinilyticus]MCZ8520935.1 hypothetical protein [Paenibacillus caseinilyticus]